LRFCVFLSWEGGLRMCGGSGVRSEGDARCVRGECGSGRGEVVAGIGEGRGRWRWGLCGGVVAYVRGWAALREGRMLVGEGACGDAWVWGDVAGTA
jgi:hypothetical protein